MVRFLFLGDGHFLPYVKPLSMACGECSAKENTGGASEWASGRGIGKWIRAGGVTAGKQERRQTASTGEDMVVSIGGGYIGGR
jgi:hypothetical protein